MPSRILDWKSPIEMLKGKNEDVIPLKIFGCVCFVQDNRPNVRKLDSKAVKCVFVGYSAYVCWSPIERRLFVSMDVTFRELEPYYSTQVASPFGDLLDTGGMRREGEYDSSSERRMVSDDDSSSERRMMSVGDIPCPLVESAEVPDHGGTEPENGGAQAQGELRVYTRRIKQNEEAVPTVPLVPSPLSLPPLSIARPSLVLRIFAACGWREMIITCPQSLQICGILLNRSISLHYSLNLSLNLEHSQIVSHSIVSSFQFFPDILDSIYAIHYGCDRGSQ
jgi:hypothetical protein